MLKQILWKHFCNSVSVLYARIPPLCPNPPPIHHPNPTHTPPYPITLPVPNILYIVSLFMQVLLSPRAVLQFGPDRPFLGWTLESSGMKMLLKTVETFQVFGEKMDSEFICWENFHFQRTMYLIRPIVNTVGSNYQIVGIPQIVQVRFPDNVSSVMEESLDSIHSVSQLFK